MPDRKSTRLGITALVALFLVDCYRYTLSFWLGGHCRFVPSCSVYAQQSIREHGARLGIWLALKRLLCCHPWHPGGVDDVPSKSCCSHLKKVELMKSYDE